MAAVNIPIAQNTIAKATFICRVTICLNISSFFINIKNANPRINKTRAVFVRFPVDIFDQGNLVILVAKSNNLSYI